MFRRRDSGIQTVHALDFESSFVRRVEPQLSLPLVFLVALMASFRVPSFSIQQLVTKFIKNGKISFWNELFVLKIWCLPKLCPVWCIQLKRHTSISLCTLQHSSNFWQLELRKLHCPTKNKESTLLLELFRNRTSQNIELKNTFEKRKI